MAKVSKHRYLKSTQVTGLDKVITTDILTVYSQELADRIDKIAHASTAQLVKLTRATAPVDAKANHQHYKDLIAMKAVRKHRTGSTYVWYVKPPGHRLTHLLVKGHAKKDGGRTRVDPFLANACDEVLPAYEAAIERTIKNGTSE